MQVESPFIIFNTQQNITVDSEVTELKQLGVENVISGCKYAYVIGGYLVLSWHEIKKQINTDPSIPSTPVPTFQKQQIDPDPSIPSTPVPTLKKQQIDPDFSASFPALQKLLDENHYKLTQKLDDNAIMEEIIKFVPKWELMNKRNDLKRHILGTTILVGNDQRFTNLDAKEQNILKWTSLLHDLLKKQQGVDYEIGDSGDPFPFGKDLVHPYFCALYSLELGQDQTKFGRGMKYTIHEIKSIQQLIDKNITKTDPYRRSTWTPTNNTTRQIIDIILGSNFSEFHATVFLLIFLHQSLNCPFSKDYQSSQLLDYSDGLQILYDICEKIPKFLELALIFMANDSKYYQMRDGKDAEHQKSMYSSFVKDSELMRTKLAQVKKS